MAMTYEEFRKAHPAVRCFQRYSPETRANHAASHRLGHRQRTAVGEYYYVHKLVPDIGFPRAKLATERAYGVYLATLPKHRVGEPMPARARVAPMVDYAEAEHEAMAVEEGRFPDHLLVVTSVRAR